MWISQLSSDFLLSLLYLPCCCLLRLFFTAVICHPASLLDVYPVSSEASISPIIHPLPFFCMCFVSQSCPVCVFEDLFKQLPVPVCVISVLWLSEHSALSHPSLISGTLRQALEGAEHPKQSVQVCREPC